MARIRTLVDHWKNHQEKMEALTAGDPLPDARQQQLALEDRPERTPIYIALPVILERTFRNTWRQPDLFWTRCAYNRSYNTSAYIIEGGRKPRFLRYASIYFSCASIRDLLAHRTALVLSPNARLLWLSLVSLIWLPCIPWRRPSSSTTTAPPEADIRLPPSSPPSASSPSYLNSSPLSSSP